MSTKRTARSASRSPRCPRTAEAAMLARIQNELFDLGADLATPADAEHGFGPYDMALRIVPAQIERLEVEIDAMNAALAPLTSYILPGGTEAAARLHLARAAARPAARAAVPHRHCVGRGKRVARRVDTGG